FSQDPLHGRLDSSVCRGNAGAGDRGTLAGFHTAHAVVHREPPGYASTHRRDAAFGARRAAAALVSEPAAVEAGAGAHVGRVGISFAVRSTRVIAVSRGSPV